MSLNGREKQIAKEKVALSRERLCLHNERKQLESRQQCSLCKCNRNVSAYNFDPTYVLPETYLPVTRDYGSTTMNSAFTAIEQEMAHLMGRNFSLRHTAVIGSDSNERYGEKTTGQENVQTTQSIQIDSGAFKVCICINYFLQPRKYIKIVWKLLDLNIFVFVGLYGSKIYDASFRRPASFKQFGSEQERRDGIR